MKAELSVWLPTDLTAMVQQYLRSRPALVGGCLLPEQNTPFDGITVHVETGLVYCVWSEYDCIRAFGPDGEEWFRQLDKYSSPTDLVLDPDRGHLYVADSWNCRIQILRASDGQFVAQWPAGSLTCDTFLRLGRNSELGILYVVHDTELGAFQEATGQLLALATRNGRGMDCAMTVDARLNQLYIAHTDWSVSAIQPGINVYHGTNLSMLYTLPSPRQLCSLTIDSGSGVLYQAYLVQDTSGSDTCLVVASSGCPPRIVFQLRDADSCRTDCKIVFNSRRGEIVIVSTYFGKNFSAGVQVLDLP